LLARGRCCGQDYISLSMEKLVRESFVGPCG
jgi:hypothetical protein